MNSKNQDDDVLNSEYSNTSSIAKFWYFKVFL